MMEQHNCYKYRDQSLRQKFDQIAEQYEKYRFSYPEELFQDIFIHCNNLGHNALEIGIGTGKGTTPFLKNGYRITAIEPSHDMLAIAQKKFEQYPIHFIHSTFEDYCSPMPEMRFDLIYAASAFQWISDESRLCKVYDLLTLGGIFARFKTVTIIQDDEKANQILKQLYLQYIPMFLPSDQGRKHMGSDEYHNAGFETICNKEYYTEHFCSADNYIALINTYTEYLTVSEQTRSEFEKAIIKQIGKNIIKITQKCTLMIARKPCS